jgi:hypothetical protein
VGDGIGATLRYWRAISAAGRAANGSTRGNVNAYPVTFRGVAAGISIEWRAVPCCITFGFIPRCYAYRCNLIYLFSGCTGVGDGEACWLALAKSAVQPYIADNIACRAAERGGGSMLNKHRQ